MSIKLRTGLPTRQPFICRAADIRRPLYRLFQIVSSFKVLLSSPKSLSGFSGSPYFIFILQPKLYNFISCELYLVKGLIVSSFKVLLSSPKSLSGFSGTPYFIFILQPKLYNFISCELYLLKGLKVIFIDNHYGCFLCVNYATAKSGALQRTVWKAIYGPTVKIVLAFSNLRALCILCCSGQRMCPRGMSG